IVARDLVEQALELGDVTVDRLLEAAVGAVFTCDLVERLLAGGGVEPLGEGLALAALIAIPHLGGEVTVHQPADVERQRFQRIGRSLALAALCAGARSLAAGVGAAEEIGQPSVTSAFLARRRDRRRFGTARRHTEI